MLLFVTIVGVKSTIVSMFLYFGVSVCTHSEKTFTVVHSFTAGFGIKTVRNIDLILNSLTNIWSLWITGTFWNLKGFSSFFFVFIVGDVYCIVFGKNVFWAI